MGFQFPNSPTSGQSYTPVGGPTFSWDGTAWKSVSQGVPVTVFVNDTPPSSPGLGQLWWESDTGNLFIWYSDGDGAQWVQINGTPAGYQTAETYNRLVNPAMQISQENNETPGSTMFFPADQWQFINQGFATSAARWSSAITSSSKALYVSCGTARPSPAADDYCFLFQPIEGVRVADLKWGSAAAIPIMVRFRAFSTNAGTYSIAIQNSGAARTFLAPLTLAASTWTDVVITVPGDTTGTWLTTNGVGLRIGFGLATGTTYGGGVAGWQNGYKMQIAGNSNFCATASPVVFYLGDVGIYADPDRTGVAPPFKMPDEAEDLRACQRYYNKSDMSWIVSGYASAVGNVFHNVYYHGRMRIAPSVSLSALVLVGSTAALGSANLEGGRIGVTSTAAGITQAFGALTFNARM